MRKPIFSDPMQNGWESAITPHNTAIYAITPRGVIADFLWVLLENKQLNKFAQSVFGNFYIDL